MQKLCRWDDRSRVEGALNENESESHCGRDAIRFSNIGTKPASLIKLRTLTCRLRQHVEDFLADAKRDLVDFLHKAILKSLKEHPEARSSRVNNALIIV